MADDDSPVYKAIMEPARSPVDDALDRLLAIVEAAEKEGRWHLSGRDVINITHAAMTVRSALEQLREERDALIRDRERWRLEWQAEVKAAEAEIQRLTEGLRHIESGSTPDGQTITAPDAYARAWLDRNERIAAARVPVGEPNEGEAS